MGWAVSQVAWTSNMTWQSKKNIRTMLNIKSGKMFLVKFDTVVGMQQFFFHGIYACMHAIWGIEQEQTILFCACAAYSFPEPSLSTTNIIDDCPQHLWSTSFWRITCAGDEACIILHSRNLHACNFEKSYYMFSIFGFTFNEISIALETTGHLLRPAHLIFSLEIYWPVIAANVHARKHA